MTTKSLQAFEEMLKDGKRDSLKKRIVEMLMISPATIDTLIASTGIKYSSLTGRLSELNEIGYVRFLSGIDRQSLIAYVSDENQRQQIRTEVRNQKREVFLKRGIREGFLTYDETNFQYCVI